MKLPQKSHMMLIWSPSFIILTRVDWSLSNSEHYTGKINRHKGIIIKVPCLIYNLNTTNHSPADFMLIMIYDLFFYITLLLQEYACLCHSFKFSMKFLYFIYATQFPFASSDLWQAALKQTWTWENCLSIRLSSCQLNRHSSAWRAKRYLHRSVP